MKNDQTLVKSNKKTKTLFFFKKLRRLPLYLFILFFAIHAVQTFAADTIDDVLVYRGGGNSAVPELRFRDESGFESETTMLGIGSTITSIKVVAKPLSTSDEKIVCTNDSAADVNCQVYDGVSWDNLVEVSGAAGSQKAYDIVYQSISGEAMVCFRTSTVNSSTPGCRIWNGSSWEDEFSALSVGAAINTLRLVSDPSSNYIAMLTRDAGNDVNVQIWDGTSWDNLNEISANAGGCTSCLQYDGSWETLSGDFIATWFDLTNEAIYSKEFDKTSLWGSEITDVITNLIGNNVYIETDNNHNTSSDSILLAVIDDANTLNVNHWNGSSWEGESQLSADINGLVAGNTHLFDLAFEHKADYDALLTYGSTANALKYRVWDSDTESWGLEQSLPTAVEDKDWHQLAADPNTQSIMLTTVGITDDIDTIEWDGSSWDGSWTSHETASNDLDWNAWYTYDYEDENNNPPVVSFNTATQKTDGSGLVDVSIEVSDTGGALTKVKIEYETDGDGACNGPWANATISGPVSVDFADIGGVPDIDNGGAYQIGSTLLTQILTILGSNTVDFDWDSKTDLPTGNATYCLRATGNNGLADSLTPDTQTLAIDNLAPSGLANFVSFGSASTVQHLNWTVVTETNFSHYEIWYGENETDVENRNGTAIEWDESDYLAMGTISNMHTHITGLTPNTSYYYKIWAIDDSGNEVTIDGLNSSTDPVGNNVPTASAPHTISQATDGTGYVTFSTTAYDLDLDGVEMRVRFSPDSGNNFYNADIVSVEITAGDTIPDDTVSIDDNDFQIGHSNHIDLNPFSRHPVRLTIVWDSKSVDNQNGGLDSQALDVIIQVTPRDAQGEIGLNYESAPFALDNSAGIITELTPVPLGTTDTTPDYTFSSTAVGDISYGGSCSSLTGSTSSGSNTITFEALAEGSYSDCTLFITDAFSNNSNILNVSTFTVDTTSPSGLTALSAGVATQTTQVLNWSEVTETNFAHYEIWYGENETDVENRNGTAMEWDQIDDSNLSSKATTSTIITGLGDDTTYFYKIWAIDIAGQEETVATISANTAANNKPTGSLVSLNQAFGEHSVDVIIEMDDADDNVLRAKIEYEIDLDGACNGPWVNATLSGPLTSDFNDNGGPPNIDNGETYQIGSGINTGIVTSSGSNTIQFQWDAENDLPLANGESACLRLTGFDETADQDVSDTLSLILDVTAPTVTNAHISQIISTDNGISSVAGIGDVITFTWNNSASGNNNSDIDSVAINLSSFGGLAEEAMFDDGTNGDATPNDEIYTYVLTIAAGSIDSTVHAHILAADTQGNQTDFPSTTNIALDNVAPDPAGNLTLNSATSTSIVLNFGNASTSGDFSEYKIHYKSASSGVSLSDTEHIDVNLDDENYNSTSSTTISDLNPNSTYVFNIWTVDDAGNTSSSTEIAVTTAQMSSGIVRRPTNRNINRSLSPVIIIEEKKPLTGVTTSEEKKPLTGVTTSEEKKPLTGVTPPEEKKPLTGVTPPEEKKPLTGVTTSEGKKPLLPLTGSGVETPEVETPFSDVQTSEKHYEAISYLHKMSIVNGYSDGSYKPDQEIKRVEFIKILVNAKFSQLEIESCPKSVLNFKDTSSNEWYSAYLCLAKKNGIVNGYFDGTFKPEQSINLAEVSKVLCSVYNCPLTDSDTKPWYKPYIDALSTLNILPKDITDFSAFVTRGEMAEMIYLIETTL